MGTGKPEEIDGNPAGLPASVRPYKRTPVFTQDTVPTGLLKDHSTKQGVWGVITVVSGDLQFCVTATGETTTLSPSQSGLVEPTVRHHVKPLGPVTFYVEFWR